MFPTPIPNRPCPRRAVPRLALALVLLLPSALAGASVADGAGDEAASAAPSGAPAPLVVATKETPPFVERDAAGEFSGFAIDLWESVASRLGVDFVYREYPLRELIDAVASGDADVGVGALTMTADRERRLDFTHPWLQAGFAIAVPATDTSGWVAVLKRFLSLQFLSVLGGLILLLLGSGVALWIAERRHNPTQFGGSAGHGIGEGFWWAAVTMTTVGYGDRFPVTRLGRAIALIWMFTALIVISTFTAAITSALTVGELDSGVSEIADLSSVQVVTVSGSSSSAWLSDRGIGHRRRDDIGAAIEDLIAGRAEALVYDEPLLRHLVATSESRSVRVLPGNFNRQEYAFAVTAGHPQREVINRAILEVLSEPYWQARLAALSP